MRATWAAAAIATYCDVSVAATNLGVQGRGFGDWTDAPDGADRNDARQRVRSYGARLRSTVRWATETRAEPLIRCRGCDARVQVRPEFRAATAAENENSIRQPPQRAPRDSPTEIIRRMRHITTRSRSPAGARDSSHTTPAVIVLTRARSAPRHICPSHARTADPARVSPPTTACADTSRASGLKARRLAGSAATPSGIYHVDFHGGHCSGTAAAGLPGSRSCCSRRLSLWSQGRPVRRRRPDLGYSGVSPSRVWPRRRGLGRVRPRKHVARTGLGPGDRSPHTVHARPIDGIRSMDKHLWLASSGAENTEPEERPCNLLCAREIPTNAATFTVQPNTHNRQAQPGDHYQRLECAPRRGLTHELGRHRPC